MNFDVLYEDAHLVVIDKPSGILVHRSKESRDSDFVLQHLAHQLGHHLYPVHRLDRATSGVLVFAKTSIDARLLQQSLSESTTAKTYIALVRGQTDERFESHRPLGHATLRGKVAREARSSFWRLAEFSGCTLLGVRIFTGRRHQIRRHLHHLAHQVIGDTTYGKGRLNRHFREAYGLPRLFLHADHLSLRHPHDDRRCCFHAPLATDLCEFLDRLPDAPRDWRLILPTYEATDD